MKILIHIHTCNDEEVIDRSLRALLDQTYPVDEILLVDNASTDGTLQRSFPKKVTVIRHQENLGTSGAVFTGFQYAKTKQYDWVWIFDADSAPRGDALRKLVELYQSFPLDRQIKIWVMASLPIDLITGNVHHGSRFTPRGMRMVEPDPGQVFYRCDATIWTGSLFKVALVQKVGLPRSDYALDWGEFEYSYRGKQSGYHAIIHQGSIVDHNIGGQPALRMVRDRIGPVLFKMAEFPPIRCYYLTRNMLYFWLYEHEPRSFYIVGYYFLKVGKFVGNFILRPATHRKELYACMRGIWDGLCKNMHHRY